MSKIKVIQDEQKPQPVEIIAEAIVQIAAGMKKINATRLSRDAIVTLIARNSHVSRGDIETVLENLDTLEQRWLKHPVVSKPQGQ